MEVSEAIEKVKEKLSTKRFSHTMRVYDEAVKLAEIHQVPLRQVQLAAIFHDYCKNDTSDSLQEAIIYYDLPKDLLQFNQELWHGPVAAMKVKHKYGIKEDSIIHAIYYHTAARRNMGLVEKVIYVADYIEPARNYPGVEEVRELAKRNLNQAVLQALKNTIIFLLQRNEKIYPDSFDAYNELSQYEKERYIFDK